MPALSTPLRRQLETAVQQARDIGEAAARAALDQLGVAESRPWDYLSAPQKELRNRLRAHGRQLGDTRMASGEQETERLITEIAYQQWHRMLFARFLAENHLLIHPELGVPVTLEECEELAEEEGAEDGWVLAGRFASRMLPQIFRPDEPALAVGFAPEHQRKLEQLLEGLPLETFTASDSLGWVYQFWQSKKKDEVNRSGVKIGANELPAVTQLFTEHYMVQFLLHNTLGAWWTGRYPDQEPAVELEYLRKLEDGTPAAGTFDGWPKTVRELKVLDPCCGSGHFLVAAFYMLVAMCMREVGLSAREACERVLRENLFGLEIDERCTQIAAFALALAAWRYPNAGGYRPLPEMNIACSGLAVGAKREEWLALADGDTRLREGMDRLYSLFKDAPVLGSLIDPTRSRGDLLTAEFSELKPLLQRALEREKREKDFTGQEIGIVAQEIAKAAELLAGKYHLVCTNVPYLGRGNQAEDLRNYLDAWYSRSRVDLATAFLERAFAFAGRSGSVALVSPQSWQFQSSYRPIREHLLRTTAWKLVAQLGSGAFETISGAIVNVVLVIASAHKPNPADSFAAADLNSIHGVPQKQHTLVHGKITRVPQIPLLERAGARIVLEEQVSGERLSRYADYYNGLVSGDSLRFTRQFWELEDRRGWIPQQSSVRTSIRCGGIGKLFLWEGGAGEYVRYVENRLGEGRTSAWIRGTNAWGRSGIVVTGMQDLPATLYHGFAFDNNVTVLVPKDPQHLAAIWCYVSSPEYSSEVRKINKKISVTDDSFIRVPFDLEQWQSAAAEQYSDGLPEPESKDPTEWFFRTSASDATEPLQVGVARLLGYRWPGQKPDALDELADEDGIVCIPPVRGEAPAADRLRTLLARAYGSEWSPAKERTLLEQTGARSKTLEEWLRNEFFEQHFKLFQHRPFIWQIWDGARSGFSVLVNSHKLDRKRLELLTYTYLGDWITRQQHAQQQGESGADERLVRARELQKKLKLILQGEAPYDIFVRWKPLEEQPLGWEPDLNDGVRMNIRPFFEAGVLRKNPNIKWGKDRGNNPAGSLWGEERINDRHLTLAEKRAARKQAEAAAD